MPSIDPKRPVRPTADWPAAGFSYHSLNFFYRKKFGVKVRKLSLDAGCGCPNRDGTLDSRGCIFCDPESFSVARRRGAGSANRVGQAAPDNHGEDVRHSLTNVAEQVREGVARLKRRFGAERFVAYFQPGTNTYGPVDRLRRAWLDALAHPDVVGLAIGTRPDCVADEVLDLLAELARQTWVVVEYGLQSIHDRSLDRLNRGHRYDAFEDAYRRTRRRSLDLGVHVILGLPGESPEDMRATARRLAALEIHSVKLHNLYAVRNTALAEQLSAGEVRLPELSEHVNRVVDFLEELPKQVVVERLCGDAPPQYLVGPPWCLDKQAVRTAVEAEFRRRGTRQGSKIISPRATDIRRPPADRPP